MFLLNRGTQWGMLFENLFDLVMCLLSIYCLHSHILKYLCIPLLDLMMVDNAPLDIFVHFQPQDSIYKEFGY